METLRCDISCIIPSYSSWDHADKDSVGDGGWEEKGEEGTQGGEERDEEYRSLFFPFFLLLVILYGA